MKSMPTEVKHVFDRYPDEVRPKMEFLRTLVFEVVNESDEIESVEETLKWGEPSYLSKHGSTLRMDWKPKSPEFYSLYFKCTSKLVDTFRNVFGDRFNYETNRAIRFKLTDEIPISDLKKCIEVTLLYHKRKTISNLGIINE